MPPASTEKTSRGCNERTRACCSDHASVIRDSPSVILVPLLTFALLLGAGLAIVLTMANSESALAEKEAILQAKETGRWFSTELDRAMLPMFSLAQFATEIPEFQSLPNQVGNSNGKGSLPFRDQPQTDDIRTHRNISGSACEKPSVLGRFNRIARKIKDRAKMPGVLVSLELSPHGMLCLIYPLNNTVDFEPGVFMDSTPVLGMDLFTHPITKGGAEVTMEKNDVVVTGPLELIECLGDSCHPVVERAFIARLPIPSETHQIKLSNGRVYNSWGFATSIINWQALVEKSGLYEEFESVKSKFLLARIDTKCTELSTDGPGGKEECVQEVIELAKTPGFDEMDYGWLTATLKLDATIDDWYMTVAYSDPTTWVPGVVTAIVLALFAIAVLIYFVMFQKKIQLDLRMEKKAIERKIRALENKKLEMEQKLKEAHATIDSRMQENSTVGIHSAVRKIDRLEEEIQDVERNIQGLSSNMHELDASVTSTSALTKSCNREGSYSLRGSGGFVAGEDQSTSSSIRDVVSSFAASKPRSRRVPYFPADEGGSRLEL